MAPMIGNLGPKRVALSQDPVPDYPEKEHMKKSANARFAIKNWDEKSYGEGQDLPRLTRASVTKIFTGDIAGEGQVEYLMMYRSDGSATFVGLERVIGQLGGRTGLRRGVASVEGTATGALQFWRHRHPVKRLASSHQISCRATT
jgi:hypothetical protein